MLTVLNVAVFDKATGRPTRDPVGYTGAPRIVSEWLRSRIASLWVHRGGGFRDTEGAGGGTSADPVDELLGLFTTCLSSLFIRAAGLICGDRNTSDAGEFGVESTAIWVGTFTSRKRSSRNWSG